MARGHKTGGRKKGTPNRATALRAAAIAASGETPLDIMIENARWALDRARALEVAEGVEDCASLDVIIRLREVADEAAFRAAPYVHSKLAPVAPKGERGFAVNLLIFDA